MTEMNSTGTRADKVMVVGIKTNRHGEAVMHRGKMVKDVDYSTTVCPECEDEQGNSVAAWEDERGDNICPVCGMMCGGDEEVVWPGELSHGTRKEPVDV